MHNCSISVSSAVPGCPHGCLGSNRTSGLIGFVSGNGGQLPLRSRVKFHLGESRLHLDLVGLLEAKDANCFSHLKRDVSSGGSC